MLKLLAGTNWISSVPAVVKDVILSIFKKGGDLGNKIIDFENWLADVAITAVAFRHSFDRFFGPGRKSDNTCGREGRFSPQPTSQSLTVVIGQSQIKENQI